jgi:hypothetical protein
MLATVSSVQLGCIKVDYVDQLGQEMASVEVTSILVFESEEELKTSKRAYEVIGQAVAEGSWVSSRGSMRKEIIKMAAEKGADAVVFVFVTDLAPTEGGKWFAMPQIGSAQANRESPGKKRVKACFLKFR